MVKIALDVMGGDNAPQAPILGGVEALKTDNELYIYFVGPVQAIKEQLSKLDVEKLQGRYEIIDAQEVITNDDKPVEAVRRKKDSSLVKAVTLVKEGKANSVVTAGNTGAFMAAGYFILGRIKGISRPALAPIFPAQGGKHTVVLDIGANMDATAENLLQYGKMGSIYAQRVFKIKNPKVGLLNVGVEEGKGNEVTKGAYDLLKNDPSINFIGNVEARDVPMGVADVIVCDGFVGNVMLKFMEGLASFIFTSLKEELTRGVFRTIGAMLLKPAFKDFKKKMDYSEHGGAPLLGVKGACIKSHGSSDAKAIKNAILKQGKGMIEVLEKFNEGI
ncbi:phosphate:acyl-[acyl carrier protein] acyltransferase [Anaerobranca californiensis DSM 14826]|jgi:glycerol-3-phosphate acyltransferase PlsX|uniref:Phosphate acyltransferase n=1 Tax=Anaerobranca californiensis DSM 14826 TaxID=1120989 RepID=A0A1M6KN74_9FIRM|nr:phosphate acyltransferase PlsX [Anaerobranca californiensis]SHJ60371.1 phosphate:acyl-[acyl carrier protein] acyltransferase [Anaerobranca californiensis DSM 14826]